MQAHSPVWDRVQIPVSSHAEVPCLPLRRLRRAEKERLKEGEAIDKMEKEKKKKEKK